MKPFDLESIDNLYDARIILGLTTVRKLREAQKKPDPDVLRKV